MESAENREQPVKASQPKQVSNSSSLSKAETLKLLNDSIDRLKQTFEQINNNSASSLPPSDTINTLLTTTQKLADAVVTTPPMPTSAPAPTKTTVKPTTPAPVEKESSLKTPPDRQDRQTATKIQKKRNLSLIVVGVTAIAVAIVAVFWLWLPKQRATLSSVPEPSITEIVTDRDNRQLEAENTPVINPSRSDNLADRVEIETPVPIEPTDSELEPPAQIPIPPVLESPGKAKNLEIATVQPELTFTPEQTLIAALQTKVAELTQNYGELITSVEVNLPENSLVVEVTDDWYELGQTRQSKLANKMLERSRRLDFERLKLKDSTGKLVARNPVIGDRIIILESDRL